MGGQTQPNSPTQVYYDPEKQQYFSYKRESSGNALVDMLAGANVPVTMNGQPISQGERMYLANPYVNPNRLSAYVPTPTPTIADLFPALNVGLAQGLINSQTPDGAMYGAGRFLAPQTTSENKGK